MRQYTKSTPPVVAERRGGNTIRYGCTVVVKKTEFAIARLLRKGDEYAERNNAGGH